MHHHFRLEVDRIRAEGLRVSIGQRLTKGRLLRLKGAEQIAAALSNLPLLATYAEVEVAGLNGAPSLFISTESLLLLPQVFLGFHLSGCPILLGVKRACAGHTLILGGTGSGKTLTLASFVMQVSRMGYPVFGVGLKDTDPLLVGSMKAAAESLTRLDASGKLHGVPFRMVSLKAGEFTHGFNPLDQTGHEQPAWMRAGELLLAFGYGGSHAQSDGSQAYFEGASLEALQRIKDWGASPRELSRKLEELRKDRDTKYATGRLANNLAIQAAMEQANLPREHPASLDLGKLIQQQAAVFFSACYQDAGAVASSCAALFIKAVVAAKRKVCPDRDTIIFVFIDEAQLFPRPLLKVLIEQARSAGIRLIIVNHDLSQYGDEWETLSMMQVRLFFSAVPGSVTARHIQNLFGTKREFLFGFNRGEGLSTSETFTESAGPMGESVSLAKGRAENRQAGASLTERETMAFTENDLLALNYDKDRFLLQVSPGAECAFFGDRAIVCQRGGTHLSFDDINRITREELADTKDKILPGAITPKLIALPEFSPEQQDKRRVWLAAFAKTAARIREAIG